MTATTDIVQKLWSLCHVLRDDGITYLQYVTELTYLLFLKMAEETGSEKNLPQGYRWHDLASRDGLDQLEFYRAALLHLGSREVPRRVQAIFANAQTALKQPRILAKLVDSIVRVLISSHNPALLDALPDKAVPETVFCYRSPSDGSSQLVRLMDIPDYPELIAQGTVGHLMTRGLLERFVKHHPGSEHKKRKAMEWFASLNTSGV